MRALITGGSGFIGTALVRLLAGRKAEILNLDLEAPNVAEQARWWTRADILDPVQVRAAARAFGPTHLFHLAAETSIEPAGQTIEQTFPVNCCGTQVLAEALVDVPVARAVLVSTQYVCGPGRLPTGDDDWFPHTDYGRSKVLMERACRAFPHPWAIIRPTYIWGPWHHKYFSDVCRTLATGRYLHPAGPPVMRSYGYVGSAAWTMAEAAVHPAAAGRVWYATEPPEDSFAFVNRLSRALGGRKVRRVPRPLLRLGAFVGDRSQRIPLNSFRYHAMTTPYPVPWQSTHATLGTPPVDLAAGAAATAVWYHGSVPS